MPSPLDEKLREALVGELIGHPPPQGPEVVAQVDVARWLDARQHSCHGCRWYAPAHRGPAGILNSNAL